MIPGIVLCPGCDLHDLCTSDASLHSNVEINSPTHEVRAFLGYDGDTVAEASDKPDSAN